MRSRHARTLIAALLLGTAATLPGTASAGPPAEGQAGLVRLLLAIGAVKARAQATRPAPAQAATRGVTARATPRDATTAGAAATRLAAR